MGTNRYNLFLAQIFLLVSFCSLAQSTVDKLNRSVDSLVFLEMKKQNIPGVSVVIVRDGKIDYVKGYGFSNLEHKVPVKPETIFQTASVGKQFTAFAVMLLVQDGKISLDDKLTKFFPDAPTGWDSITIKNMLNHTSGFGDYIDDFNYQANYTEDSLYHEFKKRPLLFKAGEKQKYSNMAYATLGIIMSKVTGKFYGDFLKERVLIPMGMTTARINSEEDIVPNRAAGYRILNDEIKNQEWVSPTTNTTADGPLILSVLDMAKWEAGLNAGKLLKKEYYDLMWTPTKLNDGTFEKYGFGWAIDSLNGKRILEHNGSWQGFESTIKRYPEKKLAVIVFANLKRARTYKMSTRILQLFQPELSPIKLKPINDNDPKTTKLLGNFVEKLIKNTVTEDMLTTEFGKEFLPVVEKNSKFLNRQGTFEKMELLDRKNVDNEHSMHHYRLVFSEESIELIFWLTKDNKIESIAAKL
ncbi:serine hydrolase domain-containing protein [Flavobacterium capsici]|uniref:Serine hydrolase domain-containing protein n=1 Tax=Flavobacterium capsici TaxID=3075618 RepID=A0AA96ETC1_9FLAO|nr:MULTISPECIES: serine hydrolase domain-containing protein [unclassified Flavobacterium]WNM18063.1 serine hydrolase domain-containing protein [Flavobacterium sp. PMR2A8]WNM22115.1 serine hydrolase domain-containing protein [Flavobacterium sp. PMTSA4]